MLDVYQKKLWKRNKLLHITKEGKKKISEIMSNEHCPEIMKSRYWDIENYFLFWENILME